MSKTDTRCYTVTHRATNREEYIEASSTAQVERYLADREFFVRPTKAAELMRAIRNGITPGKAKLEPIPQSMDLPLADVVAETEES